MAGPKNNCKKINSMLLQESLWKIDDRLKIFVESLADHEAELIRIRSTIKQIESRLNLIDKRATLKSSKEGQ